MGVGNPVIDFHAIQGRENVFVLGGGNPAMDLHPIRRWGDGKKNLVDTDFTITQLDTFKIEASCDNWNESLPGLTDLNDGCVSNLIQAQALAVFIDVVS